MESRVIIKTGVTLLRRRILRRVIWVILLIIIIYLLFIPAHGSIIEMIDNGPPKRTVEYVIMLKPWKEDEVIKEIEARKAKLGETPDSMTIYMCFITKRLKYKTISR